jgi:Fe-S cluster assembly scaffold protein SufB
MGGSLTQDTLLTTLPHHLLKEAQKAGIDLNQAHRSSTFFHVDHQTLYSKVNAVFEGKIEVMDTKTALKNYPWVEKYRWALVDRDQDEVTQRVATDFSGGYFIRILPGAEIILPLQACLMIAEGGLEQRVHNIILAEKGSKAHIISSCVQHKAVEQASHYGISEFYIEKGASLNFTMIHNWREKTIVRPRSAAQIEDGGEFVSNYLCLTPVKDVQMFPTATCLGEDSKVSFNSILYGHRGSTLDIGARAVLVGKSSKAEMITRAIAKKDANIIVRGLIEGNNTPCRGHLECKGLIIAEDARIQSIPELIARKQGAEITHEAAVGKISEQEILYLMTRRLSHDQAVSTIIRGFMDVDILGLPNDLAHEVSHIMELVTKVH